ncbi:hypothetical protein OGAPHI_003940 [Ogataea philodendri]|uniref:5-formyltetrahydrofolate cyclo-ligase n=1 Tax=Ogataea philodendri TaxID=1378263 RepID=A0A9P8P5P9_9ASCO|nr:uncharacterized protein OGAPHI_003940 [Ogataea philodendri]KAH3665752.1 hypothetical protein OGAPHI_003940 [Ogataea philodendri]
MSSHKSDVRSNVWSELIKVALPDSKFHFNFAEFIADFQGSSKATNFFKQDDSYRLSKVLFITPDNCLEQLRYEALKDGKTVLMTTYGIYRGFWLLDPAKIDPSRYEYASTLDGMEKVAEHLSLEKMIEMQLKVDVMITGTGAINKKGVRFGKGHGFFDCEWAMLYTIGVINKSTPAVAFVHDCQLLDQELKPEVFDTVCDIVVTNSQLLKVEPVPKPYCGILWDLLDPKMYDTIPPLQELKKLDLATGPVKRLTYIPTLEIDDKYRKTIQKIGVSSNGSFTKNSPIISLNGLDVRYILEILQYLIEIDHNSTLPLQNYLVKFIRLAPLTLESHIQRGRLITLVQEIMLVNSTTKNSTVHFKLLVNVYCFLVKECTAKISLRVLNLMTLIQDFIMAAHGLSIGKDPSRYMELVAEHRYRSNQKIEQALSLPVEQFQTLLYYLLKLLATILQLTNNSVKRKMKNQFLAKRERLQAFLILNGNIELLKLLKQCNV